MAGWAGLTIEEMSGTMMAMSLSIYPQQWLHNLRTKAEEII